MAQGKAVDEFLRLVAKVPNVVSRKLILREYTERLGLDEKDLQERLRAYYEWYAKISREFGQTFPVDEQGELFAKACHHQAMVL